MHMLHSIPCTSSHDSSYFAPVFSVLDLMLGIGKGPSSSHCQLWYIWHDESNVEDANAGCPPGHIQQLNSSVPEACSSGLICKTPVADEDSFLMCFFRRSTSAGSSSSSWCLVVPSQLKPWKALSNEFSLLKLWDSIIMDDLSIRLLSAILTCVKYEETSSIPIHYDLPGY